MLNHSTFSDAKYKNILTITLESLKNAGFTALSFKPLFFQGVYDKLFGRQQTAGRQTVAEQKNNITSSLEGNKKVKTEYHEKNLIKLGEQAMDLSYLNPFFCKNLKWNATQKTGEKITGGI